MNKKKTNLIIFLVLWLNGFFSFSKSILAEIVPDNSLGAENSTTSQSTVNGIPSEIINGGAQRGSALFHSFSIFNIDTNNAGYFTNPTGVTNIFARVTGGQVSNINGVLGVLGDANLFLLNTNGIIFGPNSSLDLNGSFTATTADSIIFPNFEFSTSNSSTIPLLVVDTPIGLRFNDNSGSIVVQNEGYTILQPADSLNPSTSTSQPPPNGLSVKPGKNFSLIAGNVLLDGGIINLQDSTVNIGAVQNGVVRFSDTLTSIFYDDVKKYGEVNFRNSALLSNTLFNGGSINIIGENIILDNSNILVSKIGTNKSGGINLTATENVRISGNPEANIPNGIARVLSGIISSNLGQGPGEAININAKKLLVDKTGIIFSNSYNLGSGGDINLNVQKSIDVIEAPQFQSAGSLIANVSFGPGNSGNINIKSKYLNIKDGSTIATDSLSSGNSGNLYVDADTITLDGYNSRTLSPSKLITLTSNKGKGGNAFIKSKNLIVKGGGRIETSTLGSGDAGSLNIDSQYISVEGSFPAPINNNSSIGSSALILNPQTIDVFNIGGNILNGKAGSVTINASQIEVKNGGQIAVKNDGLNDAGVLTINAKKIYLQGGEILASTQGGNGGIVNLNFSDVLLTKDSLISASVIGEGDGGIIGIFSSSGSFVTDQNSSFLANAVNGDGGRISITARGIIGSPTISATSEEGISGESNVIGEPLFAPDRLAIAAPSKENIPLPVTCDPSSNNAFYILGSDQVKDGMREALSTSREVKKFIDGSGKTRLLLKARGFIPSSDGKTLKSMTMIPTSALTSQNQDDNLCKALNSNRNISN
jgi:filamentous hemagglutinin family protein